MYRSKDVCVESHPRSQHARCDASRVGGLSNLVLGFRYVIVLFIDDTANNKYVHQTRFYIKRTYTYQSLALIPEVTALSMNRKRCRLSAIQEKA